MKNSACKNAPCGTNFPRYVRCEQNEFYAFGSPTEIRKTSRRTHNSLPGLKNPAGIFVYGPAPEHRPAETWVAHLRVMLPIGHAATDQATGHQEKENDSSLVAGQSSRYSTARNGGKALWSLTMIQTNPGVVATHLGWTKPNKLRPCRFGRLPNSNSGTTSRFGQHSANYGFLFLSLLRSLYRYSSFCQSPNAPVFLWGVSFVSISLFLFYA